MLPNRSRACAWPAPTCARGWLPGVLARHGTAAPAEDGVELVLGRALLRRSSRCELADTVCGARHARGVARLSEGVAE